MQVELSKLEDVEFTAPKLLAFQKYFAFYGLIRTDKAMSLMNLLTPRKGAPDHTRIIPIGSHSICTKITAPSFPI
jgi:hypothetical protein